MKIIVGLGNIGDKYTLNRHNIGFIFLDQFVKELEKKEGIKVDWEENIKLKALTSKIKYKKSNLLLVKPTTLMNNSGEAVSKVLNFYKESLENLIIIYDDIDLPLGSIRVREKGSAGTHNGMKSIIQELGNENFLRIRIGIENREKIQKRNQDLASYVLSNFQKEEISSLKKALTEAIIEAKKLLK